jgi:hypothetical protein
MKRMEILIVLVTVEPPAGHVRIMPSSGQAGGGDEAEEIGFTGWLGLLRLVAAECRSRLAGPPSLSGPGPSAC